MYACFGFRLVTDKFGTVPCSIGALAFLRGETSPVNSASSMSLSDSSTGAEPEAPHVRLSVFTAAEIQDSLMVVMHDLQRLEGLIGHAASNLLDRFSVASAMIGQIQQDDENGKALRTTLESAVTELQFQDMATQLIWHTSKVLQGCAFRLAAETMSDEEGEAAAPFAEMVPDRPNPVTQSEMDAGSIELF